MIVVYGRVVFAAGHSEDGDSDHESDGESRTEAHFADDFVFCFHGSAFIARGLLVAVNGWGLAWLSCAADLF